MGDALFYIGMIAVTGFILRMWLQDYRAYLERGGPPEQEPGTTRAPPQPLPGTTPVAKATVVIAIVGAMLILAGEVAGEYALGVVQEQSEMAILFGLYTLAAAFVEELIFRGFLYYDKGSIVALVASCIAVSIFFAAIHPYLWEFPEDTPWWEFWKISIVATPKGIFSTAIVFTNSLWFYYVRFFRANPLRSLIPCFAAHLASNLGVFAIKAIQGKVVLG